MPKRIQLTRLGGPEVLEYVDFIPAAPGPREVQVQNHAIGLNFIDTYHRSGLYPLHLPSGLGCEAAGMVVAIGTDVHEFAVGDRVAYATAPVGAYAEFHTLSADCLVALPDAISYEQAAAVMLKGLTVQYLLKQIGDFKGGETVLFHAAAGGVGSLACQWAQALGIKLIGIVGSPEKARRVRDLGAWAVIDSSHEDIHERVLMLTHGKKCDVVYDSVGHATWDISLNCVAKRGLLVSFGNASGPVTGVNLAVLAQRGSLFVTRPVLANYADTPERLRAMAADVFALMANGQLQVEVAQRYHLSEVATAQRALTERRTVGATILVP